MQRNSGIVGLKELIAVVFCAAAVASANAQENTLELDWPLDCELGINCWIARYMDRSIDKGRLDYRCGTRTQDDHNGTDIAVADLAAMARGVDVKAAADGIVFRLRTGMPDVPVTQETSEEITKHSCGNIVILRHAGGWQTSYCHMKQGSIQLERGDSVRAGDIIGQVGLSGLTEFPHLHFMVHAPRSEPGEEISTDPFDGGKLEDGACDVAPEQLWRQEIDYQAAAVMPPVIDSRQRTRETMWQGQSPILPTNAPALIVQSRGFHAKQGDIWRIQLVDPDGTMRVNKSVEQKSGLQRVTAFAGIRRPQRGFKPGRWRASVELFRNSNSLGRQMSSVVVE